MQSAQNFAADGAVPWGLGPLARGWAGAPREALPPRWLRGGMQSCLALPFGAGEVRYSGERGEQAQTGEPGFQEPRAAFVAATRDPLKGEVGTECKRVLRREEEARKENSMFSQVKKPPIERTAPKAP